MSNAEKNTFGTFFKKVAIIVGSIFISAYTTFFILVQTVVAHKPNYFPFSNYAFLILGLITLVLIAIFCFRSIRFSFKENFTEANKSLLILASLVFISPIMSGIFDFLTEKPSTETNYYNLLDLKEN